MVIPRSALHPDDRVLVLDNENRLHYRSIQVLRTERESVIVEGGLEAGEKVVVSPLAAAIEGMAVRVSDEDPKLGGSESS
jgi:multidrug efflux pump subunit AcrA (membrane-fusion protein)